MTDLTDPVSRLAALVTAAPEAGGLGWAFRSSYVDDVADPPVPTEAANSLPAVVMEGARIDGFLTNAQGEVLGAQGESLRCTVVVPLAVGEAYAGDPDFVGWPGSRRALARFVRLASRRGFPSPRSTTFHATTWGAVSVLEAVVTLTTSSPLPE